MKIRPQSRSRPNQQGYILLTLLLFVTILIITMAIVVPEVTFQVKRDREEEMIHRGVEYSRAIRHYVKKFGRYPTRMEDLENTNNLRFLRKRYKDPVTGKDFNSGTISVGATFQHTFAKAGTYPYSCKYHPRMKGTVVVT